MDGGVWWATVHGVAKSWTRLSDLAQQQQVSSSRVGVGILCEGNHKYADVRWRKNSEAIVLKTV